MTDFSKILKSKNAKEIIMLLYKEPGLSNMQISAKLNKSRSNISNTIKVLRENSLLDFSAIGKNRYYSLSIKCQIELQKFLSKERTESLEQINKSDILSAILIDVLKNNDNFYAKFFLENLNLIKEKFSFEELWLLFYIFNIYQCPNNINSKEYFQKLGREKKYKSLLTRMTELILEIQNYQHISR